MIKRKRSHSSENTPKAIRAELENDITADCLPSELLCTIFVATNSYHTVCKCAQVCRWWHKVATDDSIWNTLYQRTWTVYEKNIVSWLNYFKLRLQRHQRLLKGEGKRRDWGIHHPSVRAIEIDEMNGIVYTAGVDKRIVMRDMRGEVLGSEFQAHDGSVVSLHAFDVQNMLLLSGGSRPCNSVKLWRVQLDTSERNTASQGNSDEGCASLELIQV